jgi:transcriptional regulator with XRE-family HTH domain
MDLAERLRGFRGEAGFTQVELAKKAKLSKAYVSELEGDVGRRPSGEVLLRIADALGISIADLMGRSRILMEGDPRISASLQAFAAEQKLPEADVNMLAGIKWRGSAPRTKERWAYIYNAIRLSASLDRGR